MSAATVKVGQIWESCDKRELEPHWGRKSGHKRLRVDRIVTEGIRRYAECTVVNAEPERGERTMSRVRVDRFRPTSTGYRLVPDAAEASA